MIELNRTMVPTIRTEVFPVYPVGPARGKLQAWDLQRCEIGAGRTPYGLWGYALSDRDVRHGMICPDLSYLSDRRRGPLLHLSPGAIRFRSQPVYAFQSRVKCRDVRPIYRPLIRTVTLSPRREVKMEAIRDWPQEIKDRWAKLDPET